MSLAHAHTYTPTQNRTSKTLKTRCDFDTHTIWCLHTFSVAGIAFKYLTDTSLDGQAHVVEVEHPFALAGFIVCTVGLVAYWYVSLVLCCVRFSCTRMCV